MTDPKASFLQNVLNVDEQAKRTELRNKIEAEIRAGTFSLPSGTTIENEIENRLFLFSYNDKLNQLVDDKKLALENLMRDYGLLLEQDKLNKDAVSAFSIFSSQQNTMAGDSLNRLKLLRESIYTLRKDAQNADEEYKRFGSLIYFFKISFITLLIITIIFVVGRSGIISSTVRNYASIGVFVVGLWYIVYDIWYNIGRDRINYDVRNWTRNF
jgi:hypothetical protein